MIDNQTTIFDMLYPKKKITKPIRLIETFSGYGSQALALKYLGVPFEHWKTCEWAVKSIQALALKYLGVPFEHWKTCEWAVKSIQAYKDIHFPNDFHPYGFQDEKNEDLVDNLYNLGISNNYNEPMTKQQIQRLSREQLETITENIYITNNLVNIQQVKGKDLEIVDTDKYEYIMTYSFPCQDLSLAGKGKGMSDTSTRSGMLWEVERILTECHELGSMPQILLMENVPQVHSQDNLEDFNKWKDRLEELGYKNYFKDLIATDYGIPQTRNRCFMVSLLGDYSYTFPKPIPLKLKLKDMLEDNVDEKYYISDDLMEHIIKTKEEHEEYTQYDRYNGDLEMWCRVWKDKSPTLNTKAKDTKIYERTPLKFLGRNQKNIKGDYAFCVDTCNTGGIKEIENNNVRTRKLTPKEAGRLMGLKDEDIDKIQLSDSAKYHIFGDAICVPVLCAIFKEML